MNILGISCYYHDATAALVKDGALVAAAHEERFTRKRHDQDFPINAINYCLREGRISVKDVDYIGFYDKPLLKFDRIFQTYTVREHSAAAVSSPTRGIRKTGSE